MSDLLAHSERRHPPAPAQRYRDHVTAVLERAMRNGEVAGSFFSGDHAAFLDSIRLAAAYHDLGKLDSENQDALHRADGERLPVNHVDAATAHLKRRGCIEAALLAYAHHRGLPDVPEEQARGEERFFRDDQIRSRTDALLGDYLALHGREASQPEAASPAPLGSGLARRLALSCLVDADHYDTAAHYGREQPTAPPPCRWAERLARLNRYVSERFERDPESPRNRLRMSIYQACRSANSTQRLYACDSPVGTGKTTAVMAHLLASACSQRPKLRHVLVVLPYTSIITQAVEVYREALVLPGENPAEIVAEHHHQADFESLASRQLATLWTAPVIVTTAVQFFETLAAMRTGRLRKLHELPGSAIFIDETHAAIPTRLWPLAWRWLEELTEKWSCHVVLASGSLPRFWENGDFVNPPRRLPELVQESLRQDSRRMETQRVRLQRIPHALGAEALAERILEARGARLVIMNTVQSAAALAQMLKDRISLCHLSTALTPEDRERMVARVRRRLDEERDSDWALIATSCVEAGMDFSFRCAFRESGSAASLIQVAGRVNREGVEDGAPVWDFRLTAGEPFTVNPGLKESRAALEDLWQEGLVNTLSRAALASEAMRRELILDRPSRVSAANLIKLERQGKYPTIAEQCRVIEEESVLVVVDQELAMALENGETVDPRLLQRRSVRLGLHQAKRCQRLMAPIHEDEIYRWLAAYDGFLGIMAGILNHVA